MKNIISWSGGKDSTATVILAHEHNIPIDEIVMAVLWFDKSRNIPAITPLHWEFITKVAIPKFQEWGYKVTLVNGKKDYNYIFNRIIKNSKHPERNGKKTGFLCGGKCQMTSEKQRTIKKIKKLYSCCVDYQGIAIDEPERLERLHARKNAVSLLEQFNYTEKMALKLCEKYNLLSPLYKQKIYRDGCWFCPNSSLETKAFIKQHYPNLWNELYKMSITENVCHLGFQYGKTFAEVDKDVDRYIKKPKQISMFD